MPALILPYVDLVYTICPACGCTNSTHPLVCSYVEVGFIARNAHNNCCLVPLL